MDSVLNKNWFTLTLVQQMVNIGNEVKRADRFDTDSKKTTKESIFSTVPKSKSINISARIFICCKHYS